MDTIKYFCSSPRDKRVFFYAVSLPGSNKISCVCLRTLKNDKTITVSSYHLLQCECMCECNCDDVMCASQGDKVCRALEYAQRLQRSAYQFVLMVGYTEPEFSAHYNPTYFLNPTQRKELEEAETSHGSKEVGTWTPETTDISQVYKEPCNVQDEEDKKQMTSTGLVFRMKVKHTHCILLNGGVYTTMGACYLKCPQSYDCSRFLLL